MDQKGDSTGNAASANTSQAGAGPYPKTPWTIILQARNGPSLQAEEALNLLCQKYRQPIYSYFRTADASHEDAEDLTQTYLARIIQRNDFARVAPENGRFRWFLKTTLRNHHLHWLEEIRAKKRGGGVATLSMDADDGFFANLADPNPSLDPAAELDRAFAQRALSLALENLRLEFIAQKSEEEFRLLKPHLDGARTGEYEEAARILKTTSSHIAVKVNRMRQRLSKHFRAVLAETVATDGDVSREQHDCLQVLARR